MSTEMRKRVHLIYGIALSAVTVIAGICLIFAAQNLYRTGLAQNLQPYTQETITQAFSAIAIPVYLCLALTVGGVILQIALPLEKSKPTVEKNRNLILSRLVAKTDLQQCAPPLRNAITAQRKARKLHSIISAALLVICSIAFCVYACAPSRWPATEEISTKLNSTMASAVTVLLACLVIPTGYTIFTAYFCRASLDKEIELMRQASAAAPAQPAKAAPAARKGLSPALIVRYAILAVAVFFAVYGYCTGGFDDVIAKAAAICTECVGLG